MYPTVYPPVFPPGYAPPSLLNPPQRASLPPWPSSNPGGFPTSPTHGQAQPPLTPTRSPNGQSQIPLPPATSPHGLAQVPLPPTGPPDASVHGQAHGPAPLTPHRPHTPSLLLSNASIQATDGSKYSQAQSLNAPANGAQKAKGPPISPHTPVFPMDNDPPAVHHPDGNPEVVLRQWNDGGAMITLVDTGGAVRFTRGEPQATHAPSPHAPPALVLDPPRSNPWAAQTYPATGPGMPPPIPYSPAYSPAGPGCPGPWGQTIHYRQASPCPCGRVHQTHGVYTTQW